MEVAPDVADTSGDRRIERSAPVQWVGMVFARKPSSTDEANLRGALSLSIDRQTINSVLLRGSAEDTRTLLPEWMSGYSFLFPSARNLERARQLTTESKQVGAWTLTFDSADPVLRLIADRIVLNAKDAGLTVQLLNGSAADLRLVRMLPASPDPYVALRDLLTRLGLTPPSFENISPVALYNSEKAALESQEVIPLFHLRSTVALSPVVRGWQRRSAGTWDLEKVWLLAGAP